jgi:MFS family permease
LTTHYSDAQVRAVMSGLMLAIFLGALDQTIIAVALPSMSRELQGFGLLAWVVSGYLVTFTVATPLYGKFSDLYGRRRMLSLALTLFLLASVGCALSGSMPMLVTFRILQGLGGGGLISLAQATVADVVVPRERGRYQGYISGMYALASVAGPLFGGVLTQSLSWRWIFWINVPLCIAALGISRRAMRILPAPGVSRRIDYVGMVLMTTALLALLLAFTLMGQSGRFDGTTGALLAVAGLLTAGFIRAERRSDHPFLPQHLFRVPEFPAGAAVLFICFMQVVTLTVMIPLQLQTVLGATPGEVAWRLLPLSMAVPAGAFFSGRWMTATGRYRKQQLWGAAMAGGGIGILALLNPGNVASTSLLMIVIGAGIGAQFPTTLVSIQNAVPRIHLGIATASTALFRSLGAAIGVALMSSLLLAQLQNAHSEWPLVGSEMMPQGVASLPRIDLAANLASQRAANSAFAVVFLCLAIPSILSVLLLARVPERRLQD